MLTSLVIGVAVAAAPTVPESQTGSEATRREVARFDFEEASFNPDPVPQFWFRAQDDPGVPRSRPGFPRFNEAEFDHTVAATGTSSVRLPTRGGSTSLRLMPGTIPVFPGADYAVSAKVRTAGLVNARAAITVRLLREDRSPIPDTERRSTPVLADNAWTALSIPVATDAPGAAFLQIDLELLQRSQLAGSSSTPEGVANVIAFEDISGSVWFDDVIVDLIPRTQLSTQAPGNVVPGSERPSVSYRIRDLVAEPLDARILVVDASGDVIAEHQESVIGDGREHRWQPDLPGFGPYRVTLDILQGDRSIDRRDLAFVWSTPSTRATNPIGLIVPRPPAADPAWDSFAPDVIRTLGAGSVAMSMPDHVDAQSIRSVERALATGAALTIVMPGEAAAAAITLATPPSPGAKPDPGAERLAQEASVRAAPLIDALDRFGQSVTRWGTSTGADARIRPVLARFVPGPVLVLDRNVSQPDPVDPRDAVALHVPTSVTPAGVPDAVAGWFSASGGPPLGGVSLVFDAGDSSGGSERERANDFVRRAVHAWRLLGEGGRPGIVHEMSVALAGGWRPAQAGPGQIGPAEPCPEVGVVSALGDRLRGRRILGEYAVGPGVTCFILGSADGDVALERSRGCLVAWAEPGAQGTLEGYLGEGPITVVDVFGNAKPATTDSSGVYLRQPIGVDPVYIEPVDPAVARLVSGFRIEPGAASAVIAAHEHELVLDNPWPVTMEGEIRIVSPSAKQRWEVSPSGPVTFSAPGNGQARVPVTLTFPPDQESGPTPIVATVRLRGPVDAPPITVSAMLVIGLLDLQFSAEAARAPTADGPDVVVHVVVANNGARDRTLRLDASAPGRATAQMSISNLAPGETSMRKFVFKGAAGHLAGKSVRVSLTDVETPERLNRTVRVP